MADQAQQSTKPTMQNWNVAGGRLALFSKNPPTGYFRDGYCRTGPEDTGKHTIAATVNQDFLDFTTSKGNNLKDAGVTAGTKWCLCAHRWQEAMKAAQDGQISHEAVPKVHLHASDKSALETVEYKDLKQYAAEPEAVSSGRQPEHHSPESSMSGVVSESKEIGSAQPTEAPGAGRLQNSPGEQPHTTDSRG